MEPSVTIGLILAFVFGALIGLEREINERKDIKGDKSSKKTATLGLRTFALVSGLGALSGILYFQFPVMSAIVTVAFAALLITFYVFDSRLTLDIGITTEVAIIFSYVIGFLLVVDVLPVQVILAMTVLLILLMSRKERIKILVEDISHHEMNAFVSFAILAFVILPFLPNESYTLTNLGNIGTLLANVGVQVGPLAEVELINPFKLWFIVVLITGVDLLGYVLERVLGKQGGWLLASLIGGFVSSTATTISIAQESKKATHVEPLVSGAILATLISFLPIAALLITLNPTLFLSFAPVLGIIVLVNFIVGYYFLRRSRGMKVKQDKTIKHEHKIFDLVSALKFVGIYLTINIASKIALEFFGSAGFFVTTALGALTGIDAVVVNTAQLVGSRIDVSTGVWGLVLANTMNLLAKSAYSYLQGSKRFAKLYLLSMLVVISSSLIASVWVALF